MIRIVKPDTPPDILRGRGAAKRADDEARYVEGVRNFEFDRAIYSDATVRHALSAAQQGKCCFCEAKVQHISDGDIEHFRPKAGFRQARNAPLERPGYYWLAYEWSNLYFACQMCNQRSKQSLFPLADPAARVRSHVQTDELARERPLFVDPGSDDPEELLAYRAGEPFAVNGDLRATTSIRELELGRSHLMERRWELVRFLELALDLLAHFRNGHLHDDALLEEAASLLADRTMAHSEFTSLARSLVRARLDPELAMPVSAAQLIAYARGGPLES